MIVVDSSVVVSGVLDHGPEGQWSLEVLSRGDLLAPDHLLVEAHNVLRRLELGGTDSVAVRIARSQVLDLPVDLAGFATVADRVWELRGAMTAYDAAYVALAELAAAPLATLDRRLARAPGSRCDFLVPPPAEV